MSQKIINKSILGALVASVMFTASCNNAGKGGALKVAGGTDDSSGSSARYPGTVYVEMKGTDIDNRIVPIRNVGTLFNIGHASKVGLILPLKDMLVKRGDQFILPQFKSVEIKLYLSNGSDPVELKGIELKQGILVDSSRRSYETLAVGVAVEKIGPSKLDPQDVEKYAQKLFVEAPLNGTKAGYNFRKPATTYMLVAVPKDALPSDIKVPALAVAGKANRDGELQMVGFGEKEAGSSSQSSLSLADVKVLNVKTRNYAAVSKLSSTPLLSATGETLAQQLWEVKGSGLCGSSDGENYDTGATIYNVSGDVVGFGVASSAVSSGFRGILNCKLKGREDMTTVVVSPSEDVINTFKSLVK